MWKQTKQIINRAPVSKYGGNSRTAASIAGNSTLRPEVKLCLEFPCTQRGWHSRLRDPVPATEPGAKQQQKSSSSCAEHLKIPPGTAEQRPSNIAQAGEDHSSRGERQRSQAVNNPEVVVEGGQTEQRWTANRASSTFPYKLALLCWQLISGAYSLSAEKGESMEPILQVWRLKR